LLDSDASPHNLMKPVSPYLLVQAERFQLPVTGWMIGERGDLQAVLDQA